MLWLVAKLLLNKTYPGNALTGCALLPKALITTPVVLNVVLGHFVRLSRGGAAMVFCTSPN